MGFPICFLIYTVLFFRDSRSLEFAVADLNLSSKSTFEIAATLYVIENTLSQFAECC